MLRTRRPDLPARMSDIPKATRNQAKLRTKRLADRAFNNLRLFIRVTDEDRVVAYTEHGNLFGYVATGQELHAVRRDCWQIVQARAKDGNVSAVLMPI